MSKRTILSLMSLVVCIGLIASSCASPPTEARSAAEQAVADISDAEKYAKGEYQAAVDEFNKAENHMTAEEFGEARAGYEKTIQLASDAGKETGIGRELTKVDAETKLEEFQASWTDISSQIEKGRGRAAKALAVDAAAFGDSLAGVLNDFKGAEQWYELLMALENASTTADGFRERADGR